MNEPALPRSKQEIGSLMPEIALPGVVGGMGSLQMFLDGKKGVVVLFWSETCSHCVRYDSYFNEVTENHPELGLAAIASRQGETIAQIRSAISERKLRFPILHDRNGKVAIEWYTQQTPRVFLLDPARRLLYRGAIDNFRFAADPEYQPYLEPAIQAFLAGKTHRAPGGGQFWLCHSIGLLLIGEGPLVIWKGGSTMQFLGRGQGSYRYGKSGKFNFQTLDSDRGKHVDCGGHGDPRRAVGCGSPGGRGTRETRDGTALGGPCQHR